MYKILLVDDDPQTTNLLELLLAKEGYEVSSVNKSQDTLPSALKFHPNLILLDLMMPGADGISVCRTLRKTREFKKTPILFFSAMGDMDHKVAAYEAGATDYSVKPIHPTELRLKIKAILNNQ